MSKKGKSRKSSKRAKKSAAVPRGGKHIKVGGKKYHCYAKRVKKGFGRKGMTSRAFCRKDVKK